MKIVIRADASVSIGTGHVMRCLTLARQLAELGNDVAFVCRNHPGNLIKFVEQAGFIVHSLPLGSADASVKHGHAHWLGAHWQEDATAMKPLLTDADWLIVDHYALDARFEAAAARAELKIAVIDDLADRPHDCDLLLDQTYGRPANDYAGLVPPRCETLCGSEFALLRPEFADHADRSLSRRAASWGLAHILVTLGGIDADNVTGIVLDAIENMALPSSVRVSVVMGANAPHLNAVQQRAAEMSRLVEVHVATRQMAELMTAADVAIGAAGSTAWERCCLGLPSLTVVLAENQTDIAANLDAVGAAISLGKPTDSGFVDRLSNELANLTETQDRLRSMSLAARSLTDGRGAERVARRLLEPKIVLANAGMHDAAAIWTWRNSDPAGYARRAGAETSLEQHLAWFERALASPDRLLFVGKLNGEAVGHVRFDNNPDGATISIVLSPAMRGRGLATSLLRVALDAAQIRGIKAFKAVVHADNAPSRRIFERAGFGLHSTAPPYVVMFRDEALTKEPSP